MRALYFTGLRDVSVEVPAWLLLHAYVESPPEVECTRCGAREALAQDTKREAERAFGSFARFHRRCVDRERIAVALRRSPMYQRRLKRSRTA